jgi:hypothetical protein
MIRVAKTPAPCGTMSQGREVETQGAVQWERRPQMGEILGDQRPEKATEHGEFSGITSYKWTFI